MAEQIIDVGTAPNSGTGDPLRTAFIKTDNNFDQIWAAGPVGSNVRIQGNTVSTLQVNQDLALSPNGTGNVRLNNNTIPGANNTWFLGSTTNRWRGIFVGNVTAGNISTTSLNVPGDAYIGGNLTVVGNTIQIGNITTDTKTIQLANTATTDAAANGSGITVGANDDIATFLYDSANNAWTTNIGVAVGGPITGTSIAVSDAIIYGNIAAINGNFTSNVTANYFFGNGSQLTGIETGVTISNTAPALGNGGVWWNSVDGRAYVKYNSQFIDLSPSLVPDPTTYVGNVVFDDLTIENVGNILPATSNVYSLGSPGFQWKDLYVSNNTIYINSVPVALGAGNVLTVNGEALLSNDSNTTITTTGNITADYFFGDGSQLTGLNTNRILNGTSNVEVATADGNVTVTANGSATWNFATDGNLVTPANLAIGTAPGGSGSSILQYDAPLQIVGESPNATIVMGWAANTNGPDSIAVIGFNTPYPNGASNATIAVGNNATVVNYWNFDNTGVLTIPGNINYSGDASASPSLNDFFSITSAVDFAIVADSANTTPTWTFDTTGNLTIPGSLIVTTGIVGSGASPAPSLSGFSSLSAQSISLSGTGTAVNAPSGNILTNKVTGTQFAFLNGLYTATLTGSGATSDYTLNLPANAGANGQVLTTDGSGNLSWTTAAGSYGNSNVATFLAAYGSNTISTTGTITSGNILSNGYARLSGTFDESQASTAGLYLGYAGGTPRIMFGTGNTNQTLEIDNDGGTLRFYKPGTTLASLTSGGAFSAIGNITGANIVTTGSMSATGNITAGNFVGGGSNVDIIAGSYDWTFVNDGNLVLPGNTFAVKYANGTAVSLGGNYGDSNVVTLLGAFGSNAISTTGNVTAGNLIGNISITGNVTGTSANVTLVAGSFSTVFDNTGTATFPGAMQLAVYANTTVRDSSITSPQPGMMIYVTGTGMQVRGATSWNTIAGSGT